MGDGHETGPDGAAPAPDRDHRDSLDRLAEAGAQVVDLLFSDITGGTRALTIPVGLLAGAMDRGYRFDGSALTGGDRRAELDLFLVPDADTLVLIPPGLFGGEGGATRGRLYCSVRRADGQPFPGDPRSALERMLVRAAAAGYDYRVGLEVEYYLVRTGGGTIDQAVARTAGELSHRPASAGGYFGVGEDLITATRDEIVATLQRLGVGVGGAHHETGPGQEELDLLPTGGIRMADQIMTVRQVIRSVANRYGSQATFMPKPFAGAAGSGMHLFQQVSHYPHGGDALRDPGADDLSPVGRYLIAGQLAHAPGMSAVVAPTVNSYKRLAAGHRAPRHVRWARVGQASLIRVPNGVAGEPTQLELRSPDPMANPYLALAVAIGAGLDGIAQGEEPPYPLDESLVAYDDAELARMGTPRLPMSLGDALTAMAEDEVVRDALGDYVFEQLLAVKRAEWDDYRQDVSPWEHARYL